MDLQCIYMRTQPNNVLSACRTVRRDFYINDKDGARLAKGYCIEKIITQYAYRRRGLASALIQCLGWWMDNSGDADVSILYTSCRSVRNYLVVPVSVSTDDNSSTCRVGRATKAILLLSRFPISTLVQLLPAHYLKVHRYIWTNWQDRKRQISKGTQENF